MSAPTPRVPADLPANIQQILSGFLAAPEEFARRHCQNAEEATALATMDQTGLAMAARSFARKRQLKRALQL